MTNVSIEENVVIHTVAFFIARYVPVQAAVTTAKQCSGGAIWLCNLASLTTLNLSLV
jgi:hypothetical protein